MPLALNNPEAILPDIWVLRRIGHETLFRETYGEAAIVRRVDFRISDIARAALQPVLTNHHGPPLAGLDVLRYEQNPIRQDSWPDIQNHLVAAVPGLVIDQTGTHVLRHVRGCNPADHFLPDIIAMRARAVLPSFRRGGIRFRPELGTTLWGTLDEELREFDQFIKLAVQPRRGIELAASISGRGPCGTHLRPGAQRS